MDLFLFTLVISFKRKYKFKNFISCERRQFVVKICVDDCTLKLSVLNLCMLTNFSRKIITLQINNGIIGFYTKLYFINGLFRGSMDDSVVIVCVEKNAIAKFYIILIADFLTWNKIDFLSRPIHVKHVT